MSIDDTTENDACIYKAVVNGKEYCVLIDDECRGRSYMGCIIYCLDDIIKEDRRTEDD